VVDVRHLVLSDLHLGALNSVLTNVSDDGSDVDTSAPAPALTALGACLRALTSGGKPPSLVVLGDLFELALTPLDDAAATFAHFVRAIGLGAADGAVAPHVRFVAGNHDHQLWTRSRLDRDVTLVERTPPDQPLPAANHVTPMMPGPHDELVRARYIEALIARAGVTEHVTVTHSYPNYAIATTDRLVVMHHGHFIERLYRIVSALDDMFEAGTSVRTVEDLESDNAGWIDFFWSSEGDSGDAGSDIRMLYESLVSGRTIDAEVRRIVTLLGNRWRPPFGALARPVVDLTARRASRMLGRAERHQDGGVLSKDADAGLDLYLQGPVAAELGAAYGAAVPPTTFVFGHTHKPFVATRGVAGFGRPVPIVNTGGWVVDHPEPEPLKGATAVLVDEGGNVVALELYRQRTDGTAEPPHVTPVDAAGVGLADVVRARIDADGAPWAAFTAAVSDALGQRRRELLDREAAIQSAIASAEH
jgi:hypothetical protein